jgi:hypothetical protein
MVTIMKRDKVGAALSTDAEIRALISAQHHKHWIIYKHRYSNWFVSLALIGLEKRFIGWVKKTHRGKGLRRPRKYSLMSLQGAAPPVPNCNRQKLFKQVYFLFTQLAHMGKQILDS